MTLVSLTLPSDGTVADVADVNVPFGQLATAINGNLDSSNISSISGSKIQTGTIPASAMTTSAAQGWQPVGFNFTYTGNNGNKEYTGTFNGDVTQLISPGMRFQGTRSTTAPTQSMAFSAASSQHADKTSPTGITFTSAFTCEAWIYPLSYTGSEMDAISRLSTNGFVLGVSSSGQPFIYGATSGSSKLTTAYQSVPLNRWTHIAATFSAGTCNVYINGILVPSSSSGSGTAITQAGNLSLGWNGTSNYFNGYISEARVWSQVQSQASIQANMGINLAGNETGLVACFRGAGDFTDKTSNNNTLTASGGAIATQAANPFNNIEYGIFTKVGTFSGGVTPVTIFTGTDYNLPNMALNSPLYSTQRTPFGFPGTANKWSLLFPINTTQDKTTNLARWQLQNVNGINFPLPTGAWKIKGQYLGLTTSSVSQAFNQFAMMLSTTSNVDITNGLPYNKLYAQFTMQLSNTEVDSPTIYVEDSVEVTTMTPYYLLIGTSHANIGLLRVLGNTSITFESAYL